MRFLRASLLLATLLCLLGFGFLFLFPFNNNFFILLLPLMVGHLFLLPSRISLRFLKDGFLPPQTSLSSGASSPPSSHFSISEPSTTLGNNWLGRWKYPDLDMKTSAMSPTVGFW